MTLLSQGIERPWIRRLAELLDVAARDELVCELTDGCDEPPIFVVGGSRPGGRGFFGKLACRGCAREFSKTMQVRLPGTQPD